MSILVTGGTGYIASHTIVDLINNKLDVVIIDNLSNSDKDVLEKIHEITGVRPRFYEGDIRDENILAKLFDENAIDSVIHFAGLKAVGESVGKPLEYYDNNVSGTITLLKIMGERGVKNLVFSSSATVYGENSNVPFKEDYPTSATNPYGWTKCMIEQILFDLAKADPDWSIALLRYFNPIGAHESGLIGENPNGIPNNLVPYIAKVATGELPFLQVYGDDYDTLDGTGVRDYIHVVDLAEGHTKALSYIMKNHGITAINLGTGIGYSVMDVLKAYKKVSGKPLEHRVFARRQGDIAVCYADVSKAMSLLGWSASRDLDDMCRDSWNYIKLNSHL